MKVHLLIRSTPVCAACNRAKALLERKSLPFTTEDHDTPEKVEAFIAAGHRSFPRVYIDDELIGGFDELNAYLANDDDF